jgi:thiamine transporter
MNLTQVILAEGKKLQKPLNQTSTSNTKFPTQIITEIAIFSALSAVLYSIRVFTLPYGGSITLASMVPVMWLSVRRGVRVGVITGVIFGAIALFIDVVYLGASSVVATPVQAVFEYPVAFGLIGLTGVLTGLFHKRTVSLALAGAGLAVFLRFLVHYFSGVFVWYYVYAFPPGYGQWIWPAVYNGSFLVVEYIISAIALAILIKRGTLDYRM